MRERLAIDESWRCLPVNSYKCLNDHFCSMIVLSVKVKVSLLKVQTDLAETLYVRVALVTLAAIGLKIMFSI